MNKALVYFHILIYTLNGQDYETFHFGDHHVPYEAIHPKKRHNSCLVAIKQFPWLKVLDCWQLLNFHVSSQIISSHTVNVCEGTISFYWYVLKLVFKYISHSLKSIFKYNNSISLLVSVILRMSYVACKAC